MPGARTGPTGRIARQTPQPGKVAVQRPGPRSRPKAAGVRPVLGGSPADVDVGILQRTAGNRAVAGLLRHCEQQIPPVVQAKLMVGAANDPLEKEADRVADLVMRAWSSGPASTTSDEAAEAYVRRRAQPLHDRTSAFEAEASVAQRLAARRGNGHALPDVVRDRMEAGFGADFSAVRIHRDVEAADLSTSLAASAFTHGADIYFARGAYDPGSHSGQHLVAHELAHVIQQKQAGLRRRHISRSAAPGTKIIQRWFYVPPGGTKHRNVGGRGSSDQLIFDDARESSTSIPGYDVMDRHISVFPRSDGTADDFHVTFELLPNSGVKGSAHGARTDYENEKAKQDPRASWRGGPKPPSGAGKISVHFFYDERGYIRSDINKVLRSLSDAAYKEARDILEPLADDIARDFVRRLPSR